MNTILIVVGRDLDVVPTKQEDISKQIRKRYKKTTERVIACRRDRWSIATAFSKATSSYSTSPASKSFENICSIEFSWRVGNAIDAVLYEVTLDRQPQVVV